MLAVLKLKKCDGDNWWTSINRFQMFEFEFFAWRSVSAQTRFSYLGDNIIFLHSNYIYSFVSIGLALWAFGDVGSDIYLMITTYKPVRKLQYYCFIKYLVVVY